MLVERSTTWLFVRISPFDVRISPVPAAWPDPTTVLMSTIAGSTLAALALGFGPPPVTPAAMPTPAATWCQTEFATGGGGAHGGTAAPGDTAPAGGSSDCSGGRPGRGSLGWFWSF